MQDVICKVIENRKLYGSLHLMRLSCPHLAESTLPGQFIHLQIPTLPQHILRRPFSVLDTDISNGTIDILYQVVGVGSAEMTSWQDGQEAMAIGPIGNRWMSDESISKALLIGGGVGSAPLFMLCKELVNAGVKVDVVLGAQTKDALVCKDMYASVLGSEPICATDDGSYGYSGFCTAPAKKLMDESVSSGNPYGYVAVCGPEPLMRFASADALSLGLNCQVSMEKRMACGIGACLSCVVDTVDGKKRACVDGPIFEAGEVIW